ncbi:MAG: LytTR family DNA-binding domain-containing protein [Ferruginibacter sp.]|nr:LytTR family transcriptional regulator [Ferruginibacter sp.]
MLHVKTTPYLGLFYKNTNNIIRVEAFSNYSKIYCTDERHPILVAKVLKWFEQQLPQNDFIRIHRSHLVNKNYLVNCLPSNVVMQNGDIINRSRRLKKTYNDVSINVVALINKVKMIS